MLALILDWILKRAKLNIFTSAVPMGVRLGGADIQGVTDKYLILQITLNATEIAFTGHWQLS